MEKRRVHFIGHGYESIRFVIVEADTNLSALQKAEEWYKATGQTFDYVESEVDKLPVKPTYHGKVDTLTTCCEIELEDNIHGMVIAPHGTARKKHSC